MAMSHELPRAALVDLDGTIFRITPNWSAERNTEWEHETMQADLLEVGAAYLRALKQEGLVIVVVTARGQTCRPLTRTKLQSHGLWELVDHIHHRPKQWEGKRSAPYKASMIRSLSRKFQFVVAMEDEEANLEVMSKAGIPKILDAKTWHGGWDSFLSSTNDRSF